MVVPFPVVFCTTITLGLEVMGIVVILVVVPVGVVTSLVVIIAPLLLTTIIGELLLVGRVAVTGLGKILLG